jgi:hypothetical protein
MAPEKVEELNKSRDRVIFYTTALIKYATWLESFCIKDNGLPDQSCMMLSAGLSERTGLKELDFSNNRQVVCGVAECRRVTAATELFPKLNLKPEEQQ